MKRFVLLFCLTALSSLSLLRAEAAPATVGQTCPLLNRTPLAAARLAELPKGVLLRADSVTVTEKEVNDQLAKAPAAVRAKLKNNLYLVLEQTAVKRLLAREAEQWAKTTKREPKETEAARVQAYLQALTAGVKVTEADLKRYYEEGKETFGGATFEQIKPELSSFLLRQELQAAERRHLNGLSERTPVEVAETWVKDQYRLLTDNPVDRVRLSGRPSLVDFGAQECEACKTMAPILKRLTETVAGQANVLFVDVEKEPVLAARFGVMTIPLQVFFDRDGQETFRHTGVFSEAQSRAKLAELAPKQ